MSRRFLLLIILLPISLFAGAAEVVLPVGSSPKALETPHFPDRLHTYVWRNWNAVPSEKIAKVVGATQDDVRAIAESMGLPKETDAAELAQIRHRGYISIIKRNWHLLPYEQLLELLDMTPQQLADTLREDDFLWIKLGNMKPKVDALKYAPPTPAAKKRAVEIKKIVEETFGDEWAKPAEPRFAFVKKLSAMSTGGERKPAPQEGLRFIYSYFAVYGDPLMDETLDPFPDGLLQRLADEGVNGVWLHVVLRQLAPGGSDFPEFGEGHEKRLATLKKLTERAKRFGISVYLYMNEPRAMPIAFFDKRPEMKGVVEEGHAAPCTSDPRVRKWMGDSLAYVFKTVPDLGGVFTITASENLTSCASHMHKDQCPRCKTSPADTIVAQVNNTIAEGVHRSSRNAKVIVWDWVWPDEWVEPVTNALPDWVYFMSVSEWSQPFKRGPISSKTIEYSISVVGPGPRATRNWAIAKKAGLKTVAKVQLNNSWELSAVPYIPAMDLVAEHCANLAQAGIDGMMLSWSLGGYPSPNLEIAHRMSGSKNPDKNAVLDAIAKERFGDEGAPQARRAWTMFSDAFREFPYNGNMGLYVNPSQLGPANPLYRNQTGYWATMVGIPYDDLNRWRELYPAEAYAMQFEKVATGWKKGLPELEQAVKLAPPERREDVQADLTFARAVELHYRSVANQIRYVMARDAMFAKNAVPANRPKHVATVRRVASDEIAAARELFTLTRADSRVGYEASNHYYYLPQDLVEKVINCRDVLDRYAKE
jgi:hypothetical protein